MEFIKQNRVAIAVVIILLAIIGIVWATTHNDAMDKKEAADKAAQQQADKKKADEKKAAAEKKKAEASKNYSYTALPGDSYTVLARKSIQAYDKANNAHLSKAQIIAAETHLTQVADAELLEVGQKVSISNKDIKKAVSFAKHLDKAQLAAWQTYVPYVVFG